MKKPSKKELRDHRDPLLEEAHDANYDIASFSRFCHLYEVDCERRIDVGRGPSHVVIGVRYAADTDTSKGSLKLSWGYTIEYKEAGLQIMTHLALERETDMISLTHDIERDVWNLRASVLESRKLASLLERYGVKEGDGVTTLKKDRHLLVARDLIEYFHKRQDA